MRVILSLIVLLTVTACSHAGQQSNKETVYFAFGGATLSQEAQAIIEKVAQRIQSGQHYNMAPWKHDNCYTKFARSCNWRNRGVTLIGHTDTVGSGEGNQLLSERRAEAVRSSLVDRGVLSQRIRVSGRGESDPAVETGDNVKEPKNRRVEIFIH